ncbi:Uncharacterised protein [Mycolicibacterium vanbaalenii]|uniref:VWFA domain-containing protein n=1 Tax=Mycolicibacterium vanbaalenii TaxID=110539 RepID=A0A5S9RCP4_MYCVN|nr:Uncharacterised protein [Mycolicibacterium vanbaalenii]
MSSTSGAGADVTRFNLLARAIAGSSVDVASVSDGRPARTDGHTIWLPTELAELSLAASREAVIVQALLIGGGSLSPEIANKLRGHPHRAQRYFANEVQRILHAKRDIPAVGRLVDQVSGSTNVSESPAQSLVLSKRDESRPTIPGRWGMLAPGLVARRRQGPGGAASPLSTGRQYHGDELQESERSVLDDIFDYLNVAPPGRFARIMARILQSGRSRRNGGQSVAAETGATSQLPGVLTSTALAPRDAVAAQRNSGRVLRYPEWDEGTETYRQQWCRILEAVPPATSRGLPSPAPDVWLRRSVARVGLTRRRLGGQASGDDIDVDAAISAQIDLRTGFFAGDKVYVAQAERWPDLGVAILVDASGSSGQPGVQGTVLDGQKEAALALVCALEATGVRTALLTFRSQGRRAVHLEVIKSFDEGFGYSTLARLATIRPSGFTRLGAAVRHATKTLDEHAGTSHKVLVVLSDGLSFDHGYEGAYAEADARVALTEARARQIGCLCLAIGFDDRTIDRNAAFRDQEFICANSWEHARRRLPALLHAAVGRSKSRHLR